MPPYSSTKDIFCLRMKRVIDPYHKISINNLKIRVSGVPLRKEVELRIVPDKKTGLTEIRFWYKDKLVDTQQVKNSDLNLVQF